MKTWTWPGASRYLIVFIALISGLTALAQANRIESTSSQKLTPEEGAKEGAALVQTLLSEQPEVSITNQVLLRVIDPAKNEREIGATFTVLAGAGGSTNIYETKTTPGAADASMRLLVSRQPGRTNQCFLSQPATAQPKPLAGNETMVSFGGSDFWITDLSLDFLQWRTQVVTRKEMRRGQFCAVLESVNPSRAPGAYSRVLSWIAINRPGVAIVHADAYDSDNKLLKQFEPKKLEKVNGQWQLDEMEIRNRQTGSRTRIDLNPEK